MISRNLKIAKTFLLVGGYLFIGKIAGAAKEVAIAWKYGVSEAVDAYVFLMNIISWPIAVWLSLLTMILIPLVSKIKRESKEDLYEFSSELFGLTILLGFFILGVYFFIFWSALGGNYFNLPSDVNNRALDFYLPLGALIPLGIISGFFSCWIMANGKNKNTLLEGVPALFIFLFLIAQFKLFDFEPLVFSTVFGFFVYSLLLFFFSKTDSFIKPRFSFRSKFWSSFKSGVFIMAAGQIILSLSNLVEQFFAAGLDKGSLALLSYSNRLMALLLSLIAISASRSILPIFSEMVTNENERKEKIFNSVRFWGGVLFLIGLFGAIISNLFSEFLIGFVFQRGLFNQENTHQVAELFDLSVWQLPFYASAIVYSSFFASCRNYKFISYIYFIGFFSKFVFLSGLIDVLGIYAIPISTVFVCAINWVLFLVFFKRLKNG